MTRLQQICAAMLNSQEQLEKLHSMRMDQLADRWTNTRAAVLQVQLRVETHRDLIRIMGKCLQRYPAANDATTLPGAA